MTIRHHMRRLRRDTSGNVGMMTAATIVGVGLMVGGSVDVFRHEMLRKQAQNAFDRCTLAAASLDQTEPPKEVCISFVEAARLEMPTDVAWKITDEAGNREICVSGTYQLPTTFMRLASVDELQVPVGSCAQEKERKVEVSLMLDVSGSMRFNVSGTSQRRIDLLKPAAVNFVSELLDTADEKRLTSVSVIPYAGQVNIGRPMFAHLTGDKYARRHNYSSCLHFESGDYGTGLPDFSEREQVSHFTKWNHHSVFSDFDGDKDDLDWSPKGNKAPFKLVDGEWRIYNEPWWCADDPHGYLTRGYNAKFKKNGRWKYQPDASTPVGGDSDGARGGTFTNHHPNKDFTITDKRGNTFTLAPGEDMHFSGGDILDDVIECDRVDDDSSDVIASKHYRRCETPETEKQWTQGRVFGGVLKDDHFGLDVDTTQITYLSNDPKQLKDTIESYQLYDGTGTGVAMKWGFLLLDPAFQSTFSSAITDSVVESTFTDRPAAFTDSDTVKYMVLMTDGAISDQHETKNDEPLSYNDIKFSEGSKEGQYLVKRDIETHKDENGVSVNKAKATQHFKAICAAAKANRVTVFTIGFDLAGDKNKAARQELENCASTSSHYYNVTDSDIDAAFKSIAAAIQKVRLTS